MARILLAEDDDSVRIFLARALRGRARGLRHARRQKALAWVSEHPVDLLLADVVMPGIDGIELARRASDMWPHLRVIFITGFAAVALRAAETMPRESTVLAKPFHLRHLVDEVHRFLEACERRRMTARPALAKAGELRYTAASLRACSSAGEHRLDTAGVRGSIPLMPTITRPRPR